MRKIYIYDKFNRIWHWSQAALIFFLALTGFEIHGSYDFFGYETAVRWHNIAATAFVILIAFAIFWHFTTGAWKQYIPTFEKLRDMIKFYLSGIFKDEPHPYKKSELSKLNPLQRLIYLGLKIFAIPVMVISGLFYMYYCFPQEGRECFLGTESLETIAVFHTSGAFILLAFVIVHMYMMTTGHTLTSNLKAMITGYEELEEDVEKEENESTSEEETQ